MAEELKPCPFCGGTDLEMYLGPKMSFVYCKSCGAYVPGGADNQFAAERWNRRVQRG